MSGKGSHVYNSQSLVGRPSFVLSSRRTAGTWNIGSITGVYTQATHTRLTVPAAGHIRDRESKCNLPCIVITIWLMHRNHNVLSSRMPANRMKERDWWTNTRSHML